MTTGDERFSSRHSGVVTAMRMHEILLEDSIEEGDLPCYDKDPEVSAYVIDGPCFEVPFRNTNAPPPSETTVIEIKRHHRVHVPLASVQDLKEDLETLVFMLVREVAELGNHIHYDGSFSNLRSYFESVKLPLRWVIKSPSTKIDIPSDVEAIDYDAVAADRFYCLTSGELLGRIPVYCRGSEVGVSGTDEHGLIIDPIFEKRRGYFIFAPQGILTVLVEPS
jgi:hypothetical protein